MVAVFRGPYITNVLRKEPAGAAMRSQDFFVNILPKELKGQDLFFGARGMGPDYDWPNPQRGAIPNIALRTHIDQTRRHLIGSDKFFGVAGNPNHDWPVPKGKIPGITLRTHTDQTKRHLIGKDKFFGLAGHPNFDWPVPKGKIPGISLRTHTNQVRRIVGYETFFGLAGHPNYDWPVPKGYIPGIDLKTHIDRQFTPTQLVLETWPAVNDAAVNAWTDIPSPSNLSPDFLLTEGGDYILQEDGASKIIVDYSSTWTDVPDTDDTWTDVPNPAKVWLPEN